MQQLNAHAQKQLMQNMQRGEQPDMEMNGHRPQSPASAENTGSPNKRPRLEGAQFNGQPMAPNGRGQMPPQMAQNMTNMMMKNGINPQGLTPAQYQSFTQQAPGVQAKSIQVYAQSLAQHHNRSAVNQGPMPNGMMNPAGVMPNQGSPMMQPMNENFMMDPNSAYNPAVNAQLRAGMPQGANNGQGGNHALQDYQMQLMLLEQQNKKRLMMARQEQDSMTRADGQPGIPAGQGMPPGMSPGSRNGPSPNPSDQMKRTPQLGQSGLPGSPTPGGQGSPAPMNFAAQMGGQDFNPQMFAMAKMGDGMMPGQMRQPPNMNPNMQAGRMPSGNWQGVPGGQPMMQQPSQGPPQNMGTPQQRNEMPPPQAPAGGANAGRGTQPSSPAAAAQAPPTPQQTNKANPSKKKGKGGDAKVSILLSPHVVRILMVIAASAEERFNKYWRSCQCLRLG